MLLARSVHGGQNIENFYLLICVLISETLQFIMLRVNHRVATKVSRGMYFCQKSLAQFFNFQK